MQGFNCKKCGICCHEIKDRAEGIYKRIPLYPDEADRLEKIASEKNINLKMIEDLVFPDIKNKKIIVVTWRIMLEPNNVCPFYDEDIGCIINEKKPLACLAYPLAIKRVDAFNMKIDIDPLCSFTIEKRDELEKIDSEKINENYKDEIYFAKKMLKRNQKVITKIRAKEYIKEIEIPRAILPEDYNKYLEKWERNEYK